jgi:hypothetical protein
VSAAREESLLAELEAVREASRAGEIVAVRDDSRSLAREMARATLRVALFVFALYATVVALALLFY